MNKFKNRFSHIELYAHAHRTRKCATGRPTAAAAHSSGLVNVEIMALSENFTAHSSWWLRINDSLTFRLRSRANLMEQIDYQLNLSICKILN